MRKPTIDIRPPENRRRVLLGLSWYSIAIHRGITRFAHDAKWVLDGGFVRNGWLGTPTRCDGAIGVFGVHADVDERLLNSGVPVVNIGYKHLPGIARICADSEAIGRMAAEHLSSRGFQHFAFFQYGNSPIKPWRLLAFEESLRARGHSMHVIGTDEPDMRKINSDSLADFGRQLAELPKPVAVLADYDDRALTALDAALLAGLRVPEQVAVLGVGNDELRCPFASVPLSSIDNDEERIGYEAARLLNDIMDGAPPPAEPVQIPPRRVVVRQSTNILAIPHEQVATALRMIWEHYKEPIDAVRIAAEIPLSYPQLHVSFVKYVGWSMADEIERLRLEHAQQLLITTDSKLSEVAHKSGFGTADRMGRVFNRRLSTSPSEYRDKMKGASSHVSVERGMSAQPAAFHGISED